MFGINDPGIWLAYLLALVVFIPMGYTEPNGIKTTRRVLTHNSRKNEHTNFRYRSNYLYVHPGLVGIYRIQTNEKC